MLQLDDIGENLLQKSGLGNEGMLHRFNIDK